MNSAFCLILIVIWFCGSFMESRSKFSIFSFNTEKFLPTVRNKEIFRLFYIVPKYRVHFFNYIFNTIPLLWTLSVWFIPTFHLPSHNYVSLHGVLSYCLWHYLRDSSGWLATVYNSVFLSIFNNFQCKKVLSIMIQIYMFFLNKSNAPQTAFHPYIILYKHFANHIPRYTM